MDKEPDLELGHPKGTLAIVGLYALLFLMGWLAFFFGFLGRAGRIPSPVHRPGHRTVLGMMIFSIPSHIAGIYGMPRRVFQAGYFGAPQAQPWQFFSELSAVGGILLCLSSALFLIVVIATAALGRPTNGNVKIELARSLDSPRYSVFDRFLPWVVVAIALIIAAYALPIHHLLSLDRFPSPGFKPF
jgi:heme/copper-type cytochrome/quinol oxidase subunit 1